MSIFAEVKKGAVIEVFALAEECRADPDPKKVNLTVGAYRDENGKSWVLPVVRDVETTMASDPSLNHEYLPITGLDSFCTASVKVLLGDDHPALASGKVEGVQALGGTGAIFMGLQFLTSVMGFKQLCISSPTWPNHKGIGLQLGMQVTEYTYWDATNKCVNFEKMQQDLRQVEDGSVILLHACAHNPTGMDLNHEQWHSLANLIREKKHFPFFDIAYQGFASGSLDNDAWAVRYFVDQGFELLVAQSFSKNFGLYNERVGNLAIVTACAEATQLVKGQMKNLIRRVWSNPPQHGARIVATVLNNQALKSEWIGCVAKMADRVRLMRQILHDKLRTLGTRGTWTHITNQIGMFSFTGLTASQALYMKQQHHVYLMSDGRVNMCGLNEHNIDHVAQAIHDTIANCPA